MHVIDLPNLAATQAFGRQLGQRLWPGSVVALIGELGAGKTQLARAIAEGLDIADSRVVTSPTFVLVQEYVARLPIYHFDAYRLNTRPSSPTWACRNISRAMEFAWSSGRIVCRAVCRPNICA